VGNQKGVVKSRSLGGRHILLIFQGIN